MWRFIQEAIRPSFTAETVFLHIAPEACISRRLRELLGDGYATADRYAPDVDLQMDIMNIKFPADHFHYICCSHVLEHVDDDHKALNEFFRVLKPGGSALLAVPIDGVTTYEDPSIVLPEERARAFGQSDHVRAYGDDFIDRVAAVGFDVARFTADEHLSAENRLRFGITEHAGDIFLATKPLL